MQSPDLPSGVISACAKTLQSNTMRDIASLIVGNPACRMVIALEYLRKFLFAHFGCQESLPDTAADLAQCRRCLSHENFANQLLNRLACRGSLTAKRLFRSVRNFNRHHSHIWFIIAMFSHFRNNNM